MGTAEAAQTQVCISQKMLVFYDGTTRTFTRNYKSGHSSQLNQMQVYIYLNAHSRATNVRDTYIYIRKPLLGAGINDSDCNAVIQTASYSPNLLTTYSHGEKSMCQNFLSKILGRNFAGKIFKTRLQMRHLESISDQNDVAFPSRKKQFFGKEGGGQMTP